MEVGFELLYNSVYSSIVNKDDVLVVFLHWLMLKSGKKCVGTGDEWEAELPLGSEHLPVAWRGDNGIYTLRYVGTGRVPGRFLLKIVKSGSSLIINVVDVDNDRASGMTANVNNYVNDPSADRTFSNIYKNTKELSEKFQKQVLANVSPDTPPSTKEDIRTTGTTDETWPPVPSPFPTGIPAAPPYHIPENPFPRIGDRDLNPLGGIGPGGGMLMDPPGRFRDPNDFTYVDPFGNPRSFPRAPAPPGARFDPFGPPMPPASRFPGQNPQRPRIFGPDPDHLPPPGSDDMFM